MDLEHSFTVNAPVDTAWSTMMDIEGVAECFPGATVTSVEGDSFEGTCKVKLGPIALVYKGSGSFTERDDAAHRAVIDAKGKDKRGNGTAGATVTMTMAQDGSDTRVKVVTDLNVTGKPAQFGRGVMQDVSDKLLGQFVDCLAGKFDEPEPSAPEPAASPAAMAAAPPPSSPEAPDPSAPGASAPAAPTPPRRASGGSNDALDLGAAVMPTILRGYASYVAVGLGALLVGWLMGRRGR